MKIIAPSALRYPFTVVALSKSKNDSVKRSEQLFTWTYEDVVTEANKYGEEKKVLYKRHGHFDAITEGKVTRWYIKPETVVERAGTTLLEIEEPCTHETQFGGLCAECGEDMTKVDYLSREANVERATVNLTHDNTQLKVSHDEAARGEEDTKRRLLNAKKLTLVVDLDQTVIHTTCERTVAEWQADPDNPNYEAVKDVKGFQLADDHPSSNNWYYVKMRPGLEDFFDRLSKLYEMHVYTMATRAYAQAIMKIIDPDRKYFGDRILSRDENYTDKVKSLARLFRNTDMVVIIDDRADVWQYVPHLVRVPVFNFFPGAGDINASFLPKQLDLATRAKPKVALPTEGAETEAAAAAAAATVSVAVGPAELAPVAATNGDLKEIGQQLISMTTGKGADALEEQEKEQEKVIVAQQTERPLLQQQLMLDKEDAQAEENNMPSEVENGHLGHSDPPKIRHSVLNDDDRGLSIIEKHLVQVHRTFYAEYTKGKAVPAGGRIAELKGQSPKKRRQSDSLPDVAEIMARIKEKVLDGAVVVFSGIIPLGVDVQTSDIAIWIKSFGAEVATNVNRRTTHVIASPDRKTTKVKHASRYPHIKIVNAEWMIQCCTRWERVDETPYFIEVDPAEHGGSPLPEDDSIDSTGEDEDGTETPLINFDSAAWASVDDELAEFLDGTDTEDENDSDTESIRSDNSTASDANQNKKKRKRSTNSIDVSEADDSDSSATSTSKLQRRKKRTMQRVTSLANVELAGKSSGLPSPETTGPEENEEKAPETNGVAPDLEEDYDDGLEAQLLAGFDDSDGDE